MPVAPTAVRWFVNGKFAARRTTGTERFARGMVAALDARLPPGADWTLLVPPGAEPPRLHRIRVRTVGPRGAPPHVWEQAVLPAAARGGLLLNLAGSAPWIAARRSVCVVHDAAVFDCPHAYTRPFVAWYRMLFRHLARRAAGLATVSAFSRDRLAAALGTEPARWTVLGEGGEHLAAVTPDPTVLDRLGVVPGRYLLGVASENPTKNLDRLVAAFALLGPGAELVLVGGGNAGVFAAPRPRGAPPSAGAAAAAAPGVRRAGPVDDAALKALYLNARALVFPSSYEGFGLPPLEAMALGCPVIAARAASLPEVCGDAALYVDPSSVDAIADAMRRALDDDALCARLAQAGRHRAAGLTWAAAAARLAESVIDPAARRARRH